MDASIDITSFYVNPHRILELVGPMGPSALYEARLNGTSGDSLEKGKLVVETSRLIVEWLRQNPIPPLERLLLTKTLRRGSFFTYDGMLLSKGLAGADRKPRLIHLRTSLEKFGDKRELRFEFHSDGLTTSSAWGRLGGKPSMFVLGYVENIGRDAISARPYVIGDLLERVGPLGMPMRLRGRLEMYPSDFDQLREVDFNRRVSASQHEQLRSVSEERVKNAFAEVFGELFVPKDWGGEQCDLFSANVLVDGKKHSCAFAFKGPAKFRKMEIRDCGKNGDQLVRLCDAGAEIMVLQHCHIVGGAVRRVIEALASSDLCSPKRYAIFDGYATFHVLRHFKIL